MVIHGSAFFSNTAPIQKSNFDFKGSVLRRLLIIANIFETWHQRASFRPTSLSVLFHSRFLMFFFHFENYLAQLQRLMFYNILEILFRRSVLKNNKTRLDLPPIQLGKSWLEVAFLKIYYVTHTHIHTYVNKHINQPTNNNNSSFLIWASKSKMDIFTKTTLNHDNIDSSCISESQITFWIYVVYFMPVICFPQIVSPPYTG